jgi:hypothetical protein
MTQRLRLRWFNPLAVSLVAVAIALAPGQTTRAEAFAALVAAPGYAALDPDQALRRLIDQLPSTTASVFLPGADLNPLVKALLLLESEEGVVPHARHHLRYGMHTVTPVPGGRPLVVSLVWLERYNLGAVRHAEVVDAYGAAQAAPPEAFGPGPHVAYRFAMRPIQGRVADPVAISRRVIPDAEAVSRACLTVGCLESLTAGEASSGVHWRESAGHGTVFARPYPDVRDGVYAPATLVDLLALELGAAQRDGERLSWSGFEQTETLGDGTAFLDLVLDVNLGQESGVDALLRLGAVMDDSVAVIWHRALSLPARVDGEPQLWLWRAFECARGAPGAEGLCP